MNRSNEDKLPGFVDQFLDEKETQEIAEHLRLCPACARKREEWEKEKSFLEETLKSPVLPDDFAEKVVAQVTPYKPKAKRRWRWGMGAAAGILLAGGIVMAVNPGLAELVGGIFSSDRVDEGLQLAMDTDIATPVDLSVTDAGITLHVEHVIADTSRIALSYFATDNQGKKLEPRFDVDREHEVITLLDEKNEPVDVSGWSWGYADNYGIIELSLVNVEGFTKGTVQLDVREINGKKGNWLVNIPVDLTAAYEKQRIVEVDETMEVEDMEVTVHQVNFATSTTDISYSTEYTEAAKREWKAALRKKEQQFNKEIVNIFFPYHPTIGYRIENEQGDVLGYYRIYGREDRGHPVDLNMIGGTGSSEDSQIDVMGRTMWNDSFVPKREEEKLYFVLDTVFKTKPTDFSVTFKPDELPYTFEYKGYELTIDAVEQKTDYSLKKSWFPVDRQQRLELRMSGYGEQKAPELALWAIEDEAGKSYFTFNSGSATLDETDEQGRFKREIQLVSYDLHDVPEEITLHLIAETEAIKLEKEWRVPLFKN